MARPADYPRTIAQRDALEEAIVKSGLDRFQLINALELSITYVQQVRAGLSVPKRIGDRFAQVLGADVHDLFTVIEKPRLPVSRGQRTSRARVSAHTTRLHGRKSTTNGAGDAGAGESR